MKLHQIEKSKVEYVELHAKFMTLLLKYYPLHEAFMRRATLRGTRQLRKCLKEIRFLMKEMEQMAQQCQREHAEDWDYNHPPDMKYHLSESVEDRWRPGMPTNADKESPSE